MMKLILTLLFLTQAVFGCALCAVYSPKTRVVLDVKASDTLIKEIDVKWIVTKAFTKTLNNVYDTNLNNKLDKDELENVKIAFRNYVEPRDFLVNISYGKKINKLRSNRIKVNDLRVDVENGLLHIRYKILLDYKLVKDDILYFNTNDKEGYFIVTIAENAVKYDPTVFKKETIDTNSVSFKIIKDIKVQKKEEITPTKKVEVKEKIKETPKNVDENYLTIFSKKIKQNLLQIDKGNTFALITLLFISFIYGIIHAMGPGHGKSLAFSYFMSNKSSYTRAFIISQLAAFIHIIGALILVLISVFLISTFLNSFVDDSIKMITKLTAVFIMLLAVFILYKKIKNKNSSCPTCCAHHGHEHTHEHNHDHDHEHAHEDEKKMKKQDLFFVLTAGIIPCPGTVVLFLYAFVLKTYFAVILASFAISLGMGLVIFASSFLSLNLNKVSSKVEKVKNIIEIASPIFIFVLGLLLFFNVNVI
ncbi:high-affinity nickel-transporter [Arcobacter nitrofigilis DSM 7299]|uniref:Nickel/cobalt efflux system n=1 Tax=Arcobacter nitrofigilis (strain ATCC 33309 / DSM 7299 / CCUG 15893 / LMG 7604 / NCTC 12251 / CI) TaxID=572480 RepID=D5V2U1_ARCNC|nr:sulfite exporter TauE/SafE family protein [Arcobacter nitrofigilis]ADG92523.1 high-affinity nickel-transporter [Arcobacter nitrofigilis DSM 7299]